MENTTLFTACSCTTEAFEDFSGSHVCRQTWRTYLHDLLGAEAADLPFFQKYVTLLTKREKMNIAKFVSTPGNVTCDPELQYTFMTSAQSAIFSYDAYVVHRGLTDSPPNAVKLPDYINALAKYYVSLTGHLHNMTRGLMDRFYLEVACNASEGRGGNKITELRGDLLACIDYGGLEFNAISGETQKMTRDYLDSITIKRKWANFHSQMGNLVQLKDKVKNEIGRCWNFFRVEVRPKLVLYLEALDSGLNPDDLRHYQSLRVYPEILKLYLKYVAFELDQTSIYFSKYYE